MDEFHDPRLTAGGETLTFRIAVPGGTIPVVISREAMEDHFDAAPEGGKALVEAYARRSTEIDERARRLMRPGVVYSRDNPLRINTKDL